MLLRASVEEKSSNFLKFNDQASYNRYPESQAEDDRTAAMSKRTVSIPKHIKERYVKADLKNANYQAHNQSKMTINTEQTLKYNTKNDDTQMITN